MVHLERTLQLLGGHVVRSAHHLPRTCNLEILELFPHQLGQAKISDFTRPLRSMRMFSGLMSRWTTPLS